MLDFEPEALRVLCLNPAVEVTYVVTSFAGPVETALSVDVEAGGKGTNVARVLNQLGSAVSLEMLGAPDAFTHEIVAKLQRDGIAVNALNVLDRSRISVVLQSDGGETLIVREDGGQIKQSDALDRLGERLVEGDIVALSGSLPTGLSSGAYGEICRRAREIGCQTVVDCTGEPLVEALKAKPTIVKVNKREALSALGTEAGDSDDSDILKALLDLGAESAIVTDGPNGCHASQGGEVLSVRVEPFRDESGTGAGDAFLGGMLHAMLEGEDWVGVLKEGARVGAAATLVRGSGKLPDQIPMTSEVVRAVEVIP